MYELLAFWIEFFQSLNCGVIISNRPDAKTRFKASQSVPTDTVCYPAKKHSLTHPRAKETIALI